MSSQHASIKKEEVLVEGVKEEMVEGEVVEVKVEGEGEEEEMVEGVEEGEGKARRNRRIIGKNRQGKKEKRKKKLK